jgi:hypothetical protein
MGKFDLDDSTLLLNQRLEDVGYARSDQIDEIDQWDHGDLIESVVLRVGGSMHPLWISEGFGDSLALAGRPGEVMLGAILVKPASERSPWNRAIGSNIKRVRSATTARNSTRPRATPDALPQAVELTFDDGLTITVAGYDAELGLNTTWFDEPAILDGPLEAVLPNPSERDIVIQ